MKFRADGFNWVVRLSKGEKLIDSLTKLVEAENIPSCWINVIGGATSAKLGFYNLDQQKYEGHEVNELTEITGLQGNLTWVDGKPSIHLHGTFAKRDLSVVGGHVEEVVVGGTCEIFLHKWYGESLTKSKDSETGLCLIDL